MDEKYDSALLGIIQHEGKIEKFLNVVLSFLYRRTDFYRIMKSKNDRLGFPPGVSLKMITSIFQHYDALTRKDDELREEMKQETQKKTATAEPASTRVESAKATPVQNVDSNKTCDTKQCDEEIEGTKTNSEDVRMDSNETASDGFVKNESQSESIAASDRTKEKTSEEKDDEAEDSELAKQQAAFQANPESYNGAIRDNYSWSQSITDLDLRVKVPSFIRKGRDVQVDIAKKHVKVVHKDDQGQWRVAVNGDLPWEINKEECMWTLNPGENIHINMEKKEERWWDCFLTDEPKINVRKIDASRPMTDLDDEAQSKIEEMMYNDRRKKMGLPTAQEEKMHDVLRKAWDAEGSPFKGQPFDPSKLSMDPSGVVNMKP
ncbi:nudC domain-containing protein 3-like isoform X2 [Dreissena polymorpha]|uniref:nudC domain-containing protein 3-like isoform X2 n=1 Tax=Dreissena polymorpha TaxID=45954 RepID=UPI002264EF3E|nr:nudC domain-containing protein 3-like isoform X2 [Dreissena polymorpha]